jgi:hypothetical protein
VNGPVSIKPIWPTPADYPAELRDLVLRNACRMFGIPLYILECGPGAEFHPMIVRSRPAVRMANLSLPAPA